jgi:hypothetical protein
MSNSPAPPAARVADYFFVAGLHDNHLISAFETAKKNQRTGDNDASYYQQQEQAVASNGHDEYATNILVSESQSNTNAMDTSNALLNSRRRGHSLTVGPTEPSSILRSTLPEVATSASLLGVLDHVQHVIDNFDKERDTARDNVIAVHDPVTSSHAEKYKRSDSDKTITTRSHRASTYSVESGAKRLSIRDTPVRKWRSPSDPKICERVYAKSAFIYDLSNMQNSFCV